MSCCLFSCSSVSVNNATVLSLDLDKYIGKWYEIARYDHIFERGLQNATATYSFLKNGNVEVINTGTVGDKVKTSVGKAKKTGVPGLLRVSFFGPFYSDYRVLMVTPDYEYALVGSKSANYLWILSREPSVPADIRQAILAEAQRRGYDTSKLIWVNHTGVSGQQ